MCGIVGFIGGETDEGLRKKLLASIVNRGPDHSGFFHEQKVFLGYSRLAIQDVSISGQQPLLSNDGRFVMVYNGEIFNHQDLRQKYFTEKNNFQSSGDAATLIALWTIKQEACLKELNGQFSIAVWDKHEHTLTLARDHHGIVSLYYSEHENCVSFCSVIKGVTETFKNLRINIDSLSSYVGFMWTPNDKTIFQEIKKLEIGTYKKWSFTSGHVEHVHYAPSQRNITRNITIQELDSTLISAIDKNFIGDVDFGLLLSGGVDSSLIAAIIQKHFPEKKITAFTIGSQPHFKEEGFGDDYSYAVSIAKHLDLDLTVIKDSDFSWQKFDEIALILGEPNGDPAPIHLLNLCQEAKRQGVNVLISGMGADEYFGGYRRHLVSAQYSLIKNYAPFFKLLPQFAFKSPLWRRLDKLKRLSVLNEIDFIQQLYYWLPTENIRAILPNTTMYLMPERTQCSIVEEVQNIDQSIYLPYHNLHYGDLVAMNAGVELRVPFLEKSLIELCHQLPTSQKIKGNNTKILLKQLAEKYLPKEVVYRKKTGFGSPIRYLVQHNESFQQGLLQRLNNTCELVPAIHKQNTMQLFDDTKNGKIDGIYSLMVIASIGVIIDHYSNKILQD